MRSILKLILLLLTITEGVLIWKKHKCDPYDDLRFDHLQRLITRIGVTAIIYICCLIMFMPHANIDMYYNLLMLWGITTIVNATN